MVKICSLLRRLHCEIHNTFYSLDINYDAIDSLGSFSLPLQPVHKNDCPDPMQETTRVLKNYSITKEVQYIIKGSGIRSAVQLAPSAFLASAAGCTGLIQEILPPRLQGIPEPYIKLGLNCWSQKHEQPPPPPSSAHQQKAWDAPVIEASYETLLETALEPRTRARLLAVASRGAGAWLNALPVAPLGLRMDNETTRIAASLRLGLPLCRPHQCLH